MNLALRFLSDNRDRLGLARYGAAGRLSSLMLTPRFHASGHVVFLILADDRPDPVLVAKVPRLAGASRSLEREAANLDAVHDGAKPDGLPGVPRRVAFEHCGDRPILVQTALVGRAYDRAAVRRDPAGAGEAGLAWLVALAKLPSGRVDAAAGRTEANGEAAVNGAIANDARDSFTRLVARPLADLAAALPLEADETGLVERTLAVAAPLAYGRMPLVFEHGDFSAPNVMRLAGGGLGVVDWELAEPAGLPACDLFFWLTYVAFARAGARTPADHVAAFRAAFGEPSGWAWPYAIRYAERVGVARDLLAPLLVVNWARTVAGTVRRVVDGDPNGGAGGGAADVRRATLEWLRGNRYFALWRESLAMLQHDAQGVPVISRHAHSDQAFPAG